MLREGCGFLEHARPSTELHRAVLNFEIPYHKMTTLEMNLLTDILSGVKALVGSERLKLRISVFKD